MMGNVMWGKVTISSYFAIRTLSGWLIASCLAELRSSSYCSQSLMTELQAEKLHHLRLLREFLERRTNYHGHLISTTCLTALGSRRRTMIFIFNSKYQKSFEPTWSLVSTDYWQLTNLYPSEAAESDWASLWRSLLTLLDDSDSWQTLGPGYSIARGPPHNQLSGGRCVGSSPCTGQFWETRAGLSPNCRLRNYI